MEKMKTIKIALSNGTDFMEWFDGQCVGCSRYGKEESRCPLEAHLIMGGGILKTYIAKRIGFDEHGNPPKKVKCYRQYAKKKKIDNDLFAGKGF